MIKFFTKIRYNLMGKNETRKYFKYAIGEIVLVVLGILIALSINNSNENRKSRNIEKRYLENIKSDINLNLTSLKEFITERNKSIKTTDSILEYFNRKKELDVVAFNRHSLNVMIWYPFEQHDNTYQELLNSGNLSIIKNKNIKEHVQNMQTKFKKIAFIENEMQQDFEKFLYDPFFTTVDLETALESLNERSLKLDLIQMSSLLNNQAYKNGFILSAFNSNSLIEEYSNIMKITKKLITIINNELKK